MRAPNRKAELVTEDDPVERARLVEVLWRRPIVADAEAALMIGLPRSTWAALKRSPGFPAQFSLGRRVFFRVDDLRAWLEAKALAAKKTSPKAVPRAPRLQLDSCRTPRVVHAQSSNARKGDIL